MCAVGQGLASVQVARCVSDQRNPPAYACLKTWLPFVGHKGTNQIPGEIDAPNGFFMKGLQFLLFWGQILEHCYIAPSHRHHLSLNRERRFGTTDDFTTSFLHFSLSFIALWNLANSRTVHFLMLSSHLFLFQPCLLILFTVPCKMVLARPDERETWPYHCSLRFITMVRRSSCGPIACWILARTSSLVTWSVYEMRSILR